LIPTKHTSQTRERKYLNLKELNVIYKLMEYQYIDYENTDAIELMKKIYGIVTKEK